MASAMSECPNHLGGWYIFTRLGMLLAKSASDRAESLDCDRLNI
ncbi:hypothetical protein [Kamptonema sp. UHCC 0994]|nr:hypothetical protein [Kamptonema sp. UHCC 0994]MDF0554672.1 hypothetical protein [Kamptonema sp. UHCC 0994]